MRISTSYKTSETLLGIETDRPNVAITTSESYKTSETLLGIETCAFLFDYVVCNPRYKTSETLLGIETFDGL